MKHKWLKLRGNVSVHCMPMLQRVLRELEPHHALADHTPVPLEHADDAGLVPAFRCALPAATRQPLVVAFPALEHRPLEEDLLPNTVGVRDARRARLDNPGLHQPEHLLPVDRHRHRRADSPSLSGKMERPVSLRIACVAASGAHCSVGSRR